MTSGGKAHQFGGDWTSAKLKVLECYLTSYTTALKDKPTAEHAFKKGYIDSFAGSGYREARRESSSEPSTQIPIFPDLAEQEPQELLDGSARIALKNEPRFDSYIFIERNAERCAALHALGEEFPELANDIDVRQGDANDEIQKICRKNWRAHRAVLFLDPYGMQVEWATIEAIAKTKAIDLWLRSPSESESIVSSQSQATSPNRGSVGSIFCSAPRTGTTSFIKSKRHRRSLATIRNGWSRRRRRPSVATSSIG